jgi:hypothetical protein
MRTVKPSVALHLAARKGAPWFRALIEREQIHFLRSPIGKG